MVVVKAGHQSVDDDHFLTLIAHVSDADPPSVDISVLCTAPDGSLGVLHHKTSRSASENNLEAVIRAVLLERRQVIAAMEAGDPGPFEFGSERWDYILAPPEFMDPRLKKGTPD